MAPDKEAPDMQPEMCKGPSGFIMIFLGFITVFIMFNWELRMQLAGYMGVILFPLIGFDFDGNGVGDIPVITLLLAGIILVSVSSTIRHFQTDWVEMAKNQAQIKAINKALREAKMGGDVEKERKITEHQQKMMALQQNMMFNNMKMMIYTMLVAIAIFTWIWADFIEGLEVAIISTPWNTSMDMLRGVDLCFIPFKNWILIYILISFPLGMMLQHGLKMYTFGKRLGKAKENERSEMKSMLDELEATLGELSDEVTFSLDSVKEKMRRARNRFIADDFQGAREDGHLARAELEEIQKSYIRTKRRVEDIVKAVGKAKKKGINVRRVEKEIATARKSLERGAFKDALAKAQIVGKSLKAEKENFAKSMEESKEIKSLLYDVRKISPADFDSTFEEMEACIKKADYENAMKKAREIRKKVKSLVGEEKNYRKSEKKFEKILKDADSLGIDVEKEMFEFASGQSLYLERKIERATEVITDLYGELKKRISKKKRIEEAFSHSKLVISNARDHGADVSGPKRKYSDAKIALTAGDSDMALELLAQASLEAERLKKQVSRHKKRR